MLILWRKAINRLFHKQQMRKNDQENANPFLQKWGNVLVLTVVAMLATLTLLGLSYYSYKQLQKGIVRYSERELTEAALEIRNVINAMELAMQNNVWGVPMHADSVNETRDLTCHVVRDNIHVMGCGVAYRPEENNGVKLGIFAYDMESDSSSNIAIRDMQYDYTKREWYYEVERTRQPHWTEPYLGLTTNRLSTSYSMPVFDDEGNMSAIAFVDVSLEWLNHVIDQDNINPNTIKILMSKTGELLVCPDMRLNNTRSFVKALAGNTTDTMATEVERRMLAGETGQTQVRDEKGDKLYVFYAPVNEHVGWSMAVASYHHDIYRNLNKALFKMAFLALLGIALLAIILWGVTRQARRLQHIRNEKERIGSELRIAHDIQQTMIPKDFPPYPERDDVIIYGLLEPAKYVGGDLFDFYIRDEKLFFCIGDVSGKGIPASLVMAVTRSLFRTISAHEANVSRIMDLMNESMADTNESMMFVTLFLGVLDLPTGRLRYCNAGHDAPLIIENAAPNQDGNGIRPLPVVPNLPLGIMQGYKYEGQEDLVKPHSIIFLYTDGLTEAEHERHAQFGEENVVQTINSYRKENSTEDAKELISIMKLKVKEFAGAAEQSDDLTMLAIDYTKELRDIKLKRSITLPNDVQTIPQLSEFVEGVAEELQFNMEDTMSLNLALEEAVVNVMNYAYPKGTVGTVTIDAEASDERLKFVITDQGAPFDPTAKENADITLSVEDRPIGGLGIFLVRQLMDSINYERVNGCNVLTLRKKLGDG